MMFVKICGLTNPEDAQAAIEMGAQAVGFVFYPGSARFVEPESLASWIGRLPSRAWKVGVFVDEQPAQVEALCSTLGLDIAQLHGRETPRHHPRGVKVWKAFRVTPDNPPDAQYPADALLLDGPGGGRTFDWSLCSGMASRFLLAGGLDEHNVSAAIRIAQPWGVDVASGIEAAPGRKDHARMKRFIEAALQPHALTEQATT